MSITLEEVISCIFQILIEKNVPMKIDDLNVAYRTKFGNSIPYTHFGYLTLDDFIYDYAKTLSIFRINKYIILSPSAFKRNKNFTTHSLRNIAKNIVTVENRNSSIQDSTNTEMQSQKISKRPNVTNRLSKMSEPVNTGPLTKSSRRDSKSSNLNSPNSELIVHRKKPSENRVKSAVPLEQMVSNLQINCCNEEVSLINSSVSALNEQPHHLSIPENVLQNLKLLAETYDNCISCSQLPAIYKLNFKQELDYQQYNYATLEDMCWSLTDIFSCFILNNELMIYHNNRLPPNYLSVSNSNDLVEAEIDSQSDEYPLNVLKIGDEIPRQFIPPDINEIEVFVTEIYDPSKFWMILHKNYPRFQTMHDEIQKWCSSNKQQYAVPKKLAQCGLYCLAQYNGEFFRGILVKVMQSGCTVKVFFFDYGTISEVSATGLLFLNKIFSLMPRQAIKARLGKIKPKFMDACWSEDAFNYFLNYSCDKLTRAVITKIENELQEVEVLLENPGEIAVNQCLVVFGHAVFDSNDQHIKDVPSTVIPLISPIHLYPTFDEIEKAIVPSASEMYALLEKGFDYDDIYPHYFNKRNIECVNASNATRGNAAILDDPIAEASGDNYVRISATPVKNIMNNVLINSIENTTHPILPIQSMQIQIQPIHNEFFYKHYSDKMKNFIISLNKRDIEEYLRVLINIFLLDGDTQVVDYILHLLNETNSLCHNMKEVYEYFLARYAAFTSPLHNSYLTAFLDFMDIGRLLELYSVIQRILTVSTIPDNFVGLVMSEDNFITRSDFMEFPIYVYNINYEVYMDFREILYIMNVKQLPLLPVMGKVNLLKFMNSLAIITPRKSSQFLNQLLRYKINYLEKMYFVKVTFLPTLFKIMTGKDLPHSIFEAVLLKTRFSKN